MSRCHVRTTAAVSGTVTHTWVKVEMLSAGNVALKRVGARRPADVPRAVLQALEQGAESANHMEQIALDMGVLWANLMPRLADRAPAFQCAGLVTQMRVGGSLLWEALGLKAVS